MLLLELLLTGVVITIQPTKTQLLDHILKNVTVKNSLSLDNFYNQTADHVTSIDTFPEVPGTHRFFFFSFFFFYI